MTHISNLIVSLLFLFVITISLLTRVQSHSWAACTQYNAEITGQDYDDSQCVGYTRNWANEYGPRSGSFGADIGADYQPGGSSATGTWCDQTLGTSNDYSDTYDDTYPMASYTTGETITIIWPAKNHANYECFGNIPDAGMKLFYNTNVNPTSDPQTLSDWTLVLDWHTTGTAGTDGVPFQNCPSFCENTDRAVCYGDVEIPTTEFTQGSGVYTFMWYWAFNNAEDIYTTCFEAYVDTSGTGGGGVTNPSPTSRPTPQPVTPAPLAPGETRSPTQNPTVDNSGNSNSGSDSESAYIVFVPICVTGVSYNEELILEGANDIYGDVDWTIFSVSEGTFEFNVTLQTETNTASQVQDITTHASNGNHLFCSTYTSLWISEGQGIILGCSSCTDVLVYGSTAYSEISSSGGSNDDGALIGIIIGSIIGVICLIAIGVFLWYKFYYLKYNRKSNHYGSKDFGHVKTKSKSNIISTGGTKQTNISYVDDNDQGGKPTLR